MYGFQAKSDNDILILDGENYNYHLKGSRNGQGVSSGMSEGNYHTLINITNTSNVPIVMVRPDLNVFTLVEGLGYSSGQYTGFYVAVERAQDGGLSGTIDWRLYEAIKAYGAVDFGIRLRNSRGEVFYDSSYKPFKVRQVHTVNVPDIGWVWPPSSHYVDIYHTQINNPFYILMPHGMWRAIKREGTWWGHYWMKTGLRKLSATSVRVGWFIYMGGTAPSGTNYSQGYNPPLTLLVCEE